MTDPQDAAKAAAAAAGVRRVRAGMRVALGTGSTAAHAIRDLARRFPAEGPIDLVASSVASEILARTVGLPVRGFRASDRFDLMLDGADEVAADLSLTKGGGGALFREKLLARHSTSLIVLVDPTKLVERLGARHPVPVEVVPYAAESVAVAIGGLGASAQVRRAPDGAEFRTDNGGGILDVTFPGGLSDPAATERALRAIPGVVESGLFVGLTGLVLIGHPDGRVEERRPPAPA